MSTSISSVSSIIQCNFSETSTTFSTSFGGTVQKGYTNTFSGVTFTKAYAATLSAAGSTTALNLYSGLTDAFNNALSFTTLKYVLIHNNDATNALTVFGGSNPVIANTVPLRAGCTLALECSEAVTNSTAVNININPGANTISFDIILLGV